VRAFSPRAIAYETSRRRDRSFLSLPRALAKQARGGPIERSSIVGGQPKAGRVGGSHKEGFRCGYPRASFARLDHPGLRFARTTTIKRSLIGPHKGAGSLTVIVFKKRTPTSSAIALPRVWGVVSQPSLFSIVHHPWLCFDTKAEVVPHGLAGRASQCPPRAGSRRAGAGFAIVVCNPFALIHASDTGPLFVSVTNRHARLMA
jgi:hypothetical protein